MSGVGKGKGGGFSYDCGQRFFVRYFQRGAVLFSSLFFFFFFFAQKYWIRFHNWTPGVLDSCGFSGWKD